MSEIDDLEDRALARRAAFLRPGIPETYVGLLLRRPSKGGIVVEVSAPSYARVRAGLWTSTPINVAEILASDPDAEIDPDDPALWFSNTHAITFPAPLENWGAIPFFGIFDEPRGGHLLLFADLNSSRYVRAGDPAPEFAAGAIRIDSRTF